MAWEGSGKGRGGRPWRRKRERVLDRDKHLCQCCRRAGRLTPATEVDHITPLAEGGTDDETNLESICTPCHRRKTGKRAWHERRETQPQERKRSRVVMLQPRNIFRKGI